jgi:hypothetical protein
MIIEKVIKLIICNKDLEDMLDNNGIDQYLKALENAIN